MGNLYLSNTAAGTSVHSARSGNTAVLTTTSAAGNLVTGLINYYPGPGDSVLGFCFTGPTGGVGDAAWATGTYTAQLDCIAAGSDIRYGVKTIDDAAGHFARVSTSADLETKTDSQTNFTGTGIKVASTGSVSWSAGAATDMWEVLVAVYNNSTYDNQQMTLEVNEADDVTSGPWSLTYERFS